MNRYYTRGFDLGTQAIGKTEKKLVKEIYNSLPKNFCLINSTWLGEDLEELKEFCSRVRADEAVIYSGPDWENTTCVQERQKGHDVIDQKFRRVHHIGNTNIGYYFSFWLEFIKENWKHFNNKKYELPPTLQRSATVGNHGKHFLCYNRKPHEHRVSFLNKLHDNNLENFGFITATIEHPDYTFPNPIILKETHDPEVDKIINEWDGQNANDIISLGDAEYWQRHFLTVVTETTQHTDVLLSEKTFKPIMGLRPFIILGDTNLYNKLKEMGFDVFEDMFPDIMNELSNPDYEKRADYIVQQLSDLTKLTYTELEEKYKELLPRLKANKEHLKHVMDQNGIRISNIDKVFETYSKQQGGLQIPWNQEFDINEYDKAYPRQPKKRPYIDEQHKIQMPVRALRPSKVVEPFKLSKDLHDKNDIFYLWFDNLKDDEVQNNARNGKRNLTVSDNTSIPWWYEFAELETRLMHLKNFDENIHGKKHPLHNYYFIEII